MQNTQAEVTGVTGARERRVTRRAARSGAELAAPRAASTRYDGADGNGDVDAEGRGALGLQAVMGNAEHAR